MKPLKLFVLLSALAATTPMPAEVVERVVAKVNGDIVTLSDFTARQVAEAQRARVTPETVESFLRQNNARILQEAIDELLVVQKAADLGMRLRPEYIKEVIEGIKKENNIESDEAFQEQLRREGMSLDELKRNIERSIVSRQVLSREVDAKVNVSEADARAEYEAQKAEYTRPGSVELQEILVKGDAAAARREAEALVARARAGEDFAALARAHSAAPTRAAGGQLGRLLAGELNPAIEKIAFALEPGSVSDPIETPDGHKILRLVSRTEGSVVPFDEVKAAITKRLQAQRREQAYQQFVEGLRKTAIVDIRVREVPLQVDLPSSGSILDAPDELPDPTGKPEAPKPAPAERAKPAEDEEFTITPQARPERVAPTAPARPTPTPTPKPTPRS
jgi:parvulin-like peptidyl-prolyl isomerase